MAEFYCNITGGDTMAWQVDKNGVMYEDFADDDEYEL